MDILEKLFIDIKRQQRRQKQIPISLKGSTPFVKKTVYSEEANWLPNRRVVLIHESGVSLGIFQEYHHKLSPSARRLTRINGVDDLAHLIDDLPSEVVNGPHWLQPCPNIPIPIEYTPREIKAIQYRFEELLHDFDE